MKEVCSFVFVIEGVFSIGFGLSQPGHYVCVCMPAKLHVFAKSSSAIFLIVKAMTNIHVVCGGSLCCESWS